MTALAIAAATSWQGVEAAAEPAARVPGTERVVAAPAGTPAGHARRGLAVGFSLGAGDVGCDGCSAGLDAVGGAMHGGVMLAPRLAVMGELWLMRHVEAGGQGQGRGQRRLTHTIATAGVQVWLLPRLWIKGGAGLGRASVVAAAPGIETDASKVGAAIAIAAGYELVVAPGIAADIQIRAGTGRYADGDDLAGGVQVEAASLAVGAGLTWF